MDIQVLNEIANPARQASLSQVGAPGSASAQLKALKGHPAPSPGNPVSPPSEDSPKQTQEPVTPEISSVARAASAYSAAVGDGLTPDELTAIQDLAAAVRTAVSDFLNQPGVEPTENTADLVASNPDAVQKLTSSVEQAVVETLRLSVIETEVNANAAPTNENVPEVVPVLANPISVERITNGAEPNNPVEVIAPSPVLQKVSADEGVEVETPVSPQEIVAPNQQEVPVVPASPELQNVQTQNVEVGNPVTIAAPQADQGQGSEGTQAQIIIPERVNTLLEEVSGQFDSSASNPQPASSSPSGLAQSNNLFAQENPVVNPDNIRNADELINAVMENEFTSEAKKIFSEPQVIRTVADLADFILERLREIIALKQQQSQSSGETGLF